MKKILFLMIVFVFNFCFTQNVTTEEEYNYMTKGYKTQIEQGLDMKKGYEIDETKSYELNIGSYYFQFFYLKRTVNNSFAGWIVKAVSKAWNNTYWYGIPVGNKPLLGKFINSMASLDKAMTLAFFQAYHEISLSSLGLQLPDYTSLTEYNYMTKGYKTQIEQGLDMKKGYIIKEEDIKYYTVMSDYEIEVLPLYREKDNSKVGVIIISGSNYVGIPFNPEDLQDTLFEMLDNNYGEDFITALFISYIAFDLNYESSK